MPIISADSLKSRASRACSLASEGARGNRLNAIVVHADRHGDDGCGSIAESDARELVLDLHVELFLDGEQEVVTIAFQLKREQVIRQQAPQDIRPPRTDAETIGIGPRNVPEQRRARLRQACAQGGGDESEVIVLNENGCMAHLHVRSPGDEWQKRDRRAAR